MKTLKTLILISSLIMLSACSKHPSSLVGVWKSGEQGLFSTQIVLTLKADGTGMFNASVGILGGQNGSAKWEFSGDTLTLTEPNGSKSVYTVVSKSKTDLVLQNPKDGQLLSLKRIGE